MPAVGVGNEGGGGVKCKLVNGFTATLAGEREHANNRHLLRPLMLLVFDIV
jgi:hypothetical protein